MNAIASPVLRAADAARTPSRTAADAAARAEALSARHVQGDAVDLPGLLADPALGRVALVSSFGAESAVLIHLVLSAAPGTEVLFLDTGRHFPETLAYRDRLTAHLGIARLTVLRPEDGALRREDPFGGLHAADPDACCDLRKFRPLQAALAGFDSWITGRKRAQSPSRAALAPVEADGARVKLNPLAAWSAGEVASYLDRHALPRHPLVASGYPSIGCAPCTSPCAPGEDPRGGRWRGRAKTECGIHFGPSGRAARHGG